jgi:hypothetical protein
MTDAANGFPEESPDQSGSNIEVSTGLLDPYTAVIDDYTRSAAIARRVAELPGVIDTLNNQLDRSTQALHAEISHGTVYQSNPDDGTWQRLSDYLVTGSNRPVVGDRLQLIEDDVLLLVDTARGVGYSHFVNLEVRPKEDVSVATYSDAQAVDMVRLLGLKAREGGQQGVIMRNRWNQERTDPSLK